MNEYETNPQRPAGWPDGHRPEPTTEFTRETTEPVREQSDPGTPDAGSHRTPAGEPDSAYPPGAPAEGGGPGVGGGAPAYPGYPAQPAYAAPAGYPAGGGYSGGYDPSTQTQPTTAPPYQAGPWVQQQWTPNGGYGAAPHAAPEPALPPWAQPVATPRPAGSRRGRMILATGAAALVLALSAGGFGAWAALALQDDTPTAVTNAGNSSTPSGPVKVIDRSSLAQIAAAVKDSVVSVNTGSGGGSGVVLSADGFVLTNNHVVAGATGGSLKIFFADGKNADAQVIGTDPRTDLAVLKAAGVSGLTPAKLGDSGAMQVGDTVLALGSPLGLEGSVTNGIISAKDRTIKTGSPQPGSQARGSLSGLLQTDAAINPGNSGGALVNTEGEVIGINTAIATSGQGEGNIGVGFAIPSNKAKQVYEQLSKGEKVSHPFIGVSVDEAENGGALVRSVTADGPAAKAGVQQGDVVTQINGKPIRDSDDLVAVVQAGKVGDRLELKISRNGAEQTVTATLAEAE